MQTHSAPVTFLNYYYYNDNFPDILQTYTDIPMPKRQKHHLHHWTISGIPA